MHWQSLRFPPDSDNAKLLARQAWGAYLGAASRRPSWGYAWVNAAAVGLGRRFAGARAQSALGRAVDLAPWEPLVQRKALWLGMLHWQQLSADIKQDIRAVARRALSFGDQASWIIRTAVSLNWQTELRPLLTNPRHIRELDGLVQDNA